MADFWEPVRKGIDYFWAALAKTTSILASSIFLIFSIGMAFGFFVAQSPHASAPAMLMIPPLLGLLAYYYRTLALAAFLGFIFFVIFL